MGLPTTKPSLLATISATSDALLCSQFTVSMLTPALDTPRLQERYKTFSVCLFTRNKCSEEVAAEKTGTAFRAVVDGTPFTLARYFQDALDERLDRTFMQEASTSKIYGCNNTSTPIGFGCICTSATSGLSPTQEQVESTDQQQLFVLPFRLNSPCIQSSCRAIVVSNGCLRTCTAQRPCAVITNSMDQLGKGRIVKVCWETYLMACASAAVFPYADA